MKNKMIIQQLINFIAEKEKSSIKVNFHQFRYCTIYQDLSVWMNEWLFISSKGMKIYKAKSNIKTKQHIYITYMKLYMNEISRFMANSQI